MHLIEQYALATGAKIDKPFIETSFYPLPFDKYIVVGEHYIDDKVVQKDLCFYKSN